MDVRSAGRVDRYPGGTTPTAGGLVFHATRDGSLYAVDAESGEEVWAEQPSDLFRANVSVWDDPATETQYVAVAETSGGRILVYAGPDDGGDYPRGVRVSVSVSISSKR